jgi:hypothetical protein
MRASYHTTTTQKVTATLQGRAASYWVNAQADAKLAGAIMHHIQKPKLSDTDPRFAILLAHANTLSHRTAFLAGCAFTLWEINGRMDWEVALLYAKLSGFEKHLPALHFSSPSPTIMPLLTSWVLPLLGNKRGLRRFLAKHQLTITVSNNVLRQAIITIQEINSAHNRKTIEVLAQASTKHCETLKKLCNLSANPHYCLVAASKTQQAAIFWDQLYIKLLTVFK